MTAELESMLLAPVALYFFLFVALILWLTRPVYKSDRIERMNLVEILLLGLACQCAHFVEEFISGLHLLAPPLFDLAPLSAEYFVGLNLFWMGVWTIAAVGILRGFRIALLPVWFFGLIMSFNGIAHPALAIWTGGYFPGLVTSPVAGLAGLVILRKLHQMTRV